MKPTASVSKWKISTYILAATTAFVFYQGHRDRAARAEADSIEPAKRDASYEKRMSSLSRLRLPAGLAGVDERQLLRDLKTTGSEQQKRLICERLGIFGTDLSLDALMQLSKDEPRLASSAISAMGGIGSDRATDELIGMMSSRLRSQQRYVVQALAKTKNPRAEMQIIEWAQGGERDRKLASIEALGTIGGEDAFALLEALAQSNDTQVMYSVLSAAGTLGSHAAVKILQEVAERGNRHLRIAALRQMPNNLNEEQGEWLMNMLAQSEPESAAEAAAALGRAGVADALPLLLDAARTGAPSLRRGAVGALAKLGGKEAQEAIVELFESVGQQSAYDVGQALLDTGEEGRAVFLAAMGRGHVSNQQLIYLLSDLSGDDVDKVRMDIARNGRPMEKQAVFSQLMGREDDEVIDLMLEMAKKGPQQFRGSAMSLLAQSSSPQARDAIIEIARGRGPASVDALRILGEGANGSPEASSILMEALHSKNQGKMQAATWALASLGTDESRDALLSAMQSDDLRLARLATESIAQLGSTGEVMDTLQDLAQNAKDPQIKSSALRQLVNSGSEQAGQIVVSAIEKGEPGADYLISSVLMNGGAASQSVIAAAAASDNPGTRGALAGALAMQGGDEKSMTLLARLSEDDDASVQSSAIYALSSIGSSESVDRIVALASKGDKKTRQVALSVLGNTGDPRASALIADALQSGDAELAQNAIYSSQNAGPEVDGALLALAENGETAMHIRQQAINTLVSRGADVDEGTLAALKKETGVGDMPGGMYPEY